MGKLEGRLVFKVDVFHGMKLGESDYNRIIYWNFRYLIFLLLSLYIEILYYIKLTNLLGNSRNRPLLFKY